MCSDETECVPPDCTGQTQPMPAEDYTHAQVQSQTHLDLMEEDKPLIPGVTVRAATPERLVHLCVESFGKDGRLVEDNEFPSVLFLMHKWFMTSDEMAEAYVDLYQSCSDTVACMKPGCNHRPSSIDCQIQIYKAKICYAVRFWISNFPVHFDLDHRLSTVVKRFANLVQCEGNLTLKQLIDLSKVPSYDWMRNMSVRNPSMRHNRKVSLVFNHLEPMELAEHLTYLEYKAFRRINFTDFKNYAVTASLKDNPKLERSIALFNGLSQWIQCMVLSKTTPQQRADVIVKFVNVAKKLRILQNFNTLMSVVGGLTHSALARLAKTNACIPSETQKTLMEFTELLSSNNNFSNYRKVFNQCCHFKIPILGVHLKDLILLHTALPDKVEGSLVNFRKMAQLSQTLKELTKLQNHDNIPVCANMDLVNTLRLSLDLHYTEDEIYELSLAREPRNSLSSPSTPTKPVVFADWLAGVSPPVPNTINKHVHDMVEAVFKNYDHDKDGFISHEEFESIAGNFPFIDSFCVLDADKDGMISKAEMKTYFIRANCHALRKCFKHDFHEITYFKPTFCIHCTGLLWGLIKQGWKCKDCGINAHKHCKDLVVMECRSKQHAACNRRQDSVTNGTPTQELTYSSKRKMSQRQKRNRVHQGTQTEEIYFMDYQMRNSHMNGDGEYYEEQGQLYDRLLKAEEARDKLMAENARLEAKLEASNDQIVTLKSHVGMIRKNTITFILEQMDALHIQRDTEV
ncbi:ras guanyl-releasing protein 3-like isoform X2 [Mizuhopecten yessoensis]|uniref:ras guanyl-releasing protein 3-like isoform X2 n=1 Tax=Mizuhopecten yessoensis TaxID=6573 RepID=UPI000B458CD2|nr:ras guanyl-releasing protein 3-like isoform X2 [Mizuhopecten yessoensis]